MNLQWILSSDLSYCHLPVIWLLDSCLLFRSTWARTLVSQLTLGINVNRQRSIKLFNPCDLIFTLVNKSLGLLLLVLSIWILVPNQNPCDLLWISSEQTFEKYENIKRWMWRGVQCTLCIDAQCAYNIRTLCIYAECALHTPSHLSFNVLVFFICLFRWYS